MPDKTRMNPVSWRGFVFISWSLLLLPLYFLYRQVSAQPLPVKTITENQVLLSDRFGTLTLTRITEKEEHKERSTRYQLRLCEDCVAVIKAAFLSATQPQVENAGTICNGDFTVLDCRLPLESGRPERIWLTLEDWQGHTDQIPLMWE